MDDVQESKKRIKAEILASNGEFWAKKCEEISGRDLMEWMKAAGAAFTPGDIGAGVADNPAICEMILAYLINENVDAIRDIPAPIYAYGLHAARLAFFAALGAALPPAS